MSAAQLAADRQQITRFVDALFRYADQGTFISLRAFDQFRRDRPPEVILPVKFNGDPEVLISYATRCADECARAAHPVVFAPPVCTFSNPDRARSCDVANGLCLSVELDAGDTAAAQRTLEALLGPVTLAVASGSEWADPETGQLFLKLHLHWRLSEPTRNPDDHVKLTMARDLAARLVGADPTAKPVAHPLRWPGSWNTKGKPRLAQIITENLAAEIHLDEALEKLGEAVEKPGLAAAGLPPSGDPEAPIELLQSAMQAIPNANTDVHYAEWIRMGYACYRACGGDAGFELWDEWSARSAKYNAKETQAAWQRIANAISKSKAYRTIGTGSIFFDAKKAGWTRPKPKAAGGNTQPPPEPDITITVVAGLRHEAADAALAALKTTAAQIYVRDKALVRVCRVAAKSANGTVTTTPAVVPITVPMLGRAAGQAAIWIKYNAKNEPRRIDPPKEILEQIAGMIGDWPFQPLAGIINTPTMRPDGSLLTQSGYDSETGYFLFDPPQMPPIPERPTRPDAEKALELLEGLLLEFPFTDEPSKSVALSMMITPVLRCAFDVVPMHIATAPTSGTGKTHLMNVAAAIATGDRCAVIALATDPDEVEKRLVGAALAQQPIIAIDNITELLMGDFLCQATEQSWVATAPARDQHHGPLREYFHRVCQREQPGDRCGQRQAHNPGLAGCRAGEPRRPGIQLRSVHDRLGQPR
jgi:Primase C terminal 2 (PriCT-2)